MYRVPFNIKICSLYIYENTNEFLNYKHSK